MQAPEKYEVSFETNEGKFLVEADADIWVPDAEKMEIKPVKPGQISQEDLDRVTGVLFQGQPLMQYQDEEQAGMTRRADWFPHGFFMEVWNWSIQREKIIF